MTTNEQIVPLNMNGLSGRMLHLPNAKANGRHVLLLYGHHSSIERMSGIAEDLHQYGSVTLPDLPGFGGMDSFYQIGMKPTLDNFADYLAAFIRLRFKGKKVTIVAMSFSFLVATRMLQNSPKLAKQVDLLVSAVGFCHRDDFAFSRTRHAVYLWSARFFSMRLPALFFRNVFLHPALLRTFYSKTYNAKNKFKNLSPQEAERTMEFEVYLWRCNEVRTYMKVAVIMLSIDNCKKRVNMPVQHISVNGDQYFIGSHVEQHMRVVFTDFVEHKAVMEAHAPSIIADKAIASSMTPESLRKLLRTTT